MSDTAEEDLLEHFQLNGEWEIVQSKVLQGITQSHKYDDDFGYSWVRPHIEVT